MKTYYMISKVYSRVEVEKIEIADATPEEVDEILEDKTDEVSQAFGTSIILTEAELKKLKSTI